MNSCVTEASNSDCFVQNSQENICIVLLVGIPASGKSSFRIFLENYFKTNTKTVLGCVKVFSVSYDDFSTVRNPNQFSDSVSWKEDRLEIFKKIEKIIGHLKNCTPQGFDISLENITVINSDIVNHNTVLFLIDDNMYYRSMRYEYYKLARSLNISFCQLFFNATVHEALQYNKKREPQSQVPDFVIERMFEKLEPPDKTISWEKNMLYLTPYLDLENEIVLDSILSEIKTALQSPVQQNFKSLEREEAQKINDSSAIHQIDIVLKQLIGDLIKNRIKEQRGNPSTVSLYFSEQRLQILKEIKDRKIVLPVDISVPICKQDVEVIKPILSEMLDLSLGQ